MTATRLLSARFERRREPRERARLAAHLDDCPACEQCAKQFRWLRRMLRAWKR